jgi:hypothetical protein
MAKKVLLKVLTFLKPEFSASLVILLFSKNPSSRSLIA